MPRARKRKAPPGCYWRRNLLWGRIQVTGGPDIRWPLHTDDYETAKRRRAAEYGRKVAIQHHGDHRRTIEEAIASWGGAIVDQISGKTLTRYLSSLDVLKPQLQGLYLDDLDKKKIGAIVEARRVPYVPKGKKKPMRVKIATVKRDLTALSSVIDHCIDEDWMQHNPVAEWLRPSRRKKARLTERRDPIVMPDPASIQLVIDRAGGLMKEMIKAALKTGARLDELAKGVRPHFDEGRKQLTVIGKRNRLRVIALEDRGEDFGLDLFSKLPAAIETKALFWHRHKAGRRLGGLPPAMPYKQISSNFARIVESVADQAQKQAHEKGSSVSSFRRFRFHDMRHIHAVAWLKSGRSIYVLQQRLGHTSIKTTEMYLRYLTPDEVETVKRASTV